MCMEDVRLGRKTSVEQKSFGATAASAPGLPEDTTRVSVVLSNRGPNNVYLTLKADDLAAAGICIAPNLRPVTFDIARHGTIVTHGFFVICDAAQTATLNTWATYL